MKWYKVKALMLRDLTIVRGAKYRLIEYFYFPITTIIIWGLFALYSRQFALETGVMVLVVNIFWSFALLAQSNANMSMNEDVWSGSIKQILLSGISETEYIIARIFSAGIMSLIILSIMLFMGFSFFGMGLVFSRIDVLLLMLVSTYISSISLAVLVAALLMYLGREYTFMAWTVLQLFILFSAPFYPAEIFPTPIREFSFFMPYTRIFSGIRAVIETGSITYLALLEALVVALIYLVIVFPIYFHSFSRARRKGIIVRMD